MAGAGPRRRTEGAGDRFAIGYAFYGYPANMRRSPQTRRGLISTILVFFVVTFAVDMALTDASFEQGALIAGTATAVWVFLMAVSSRVRSDRLN